MKKSLSLFLALILCFSILITPVLAARYTKNLEVIYTDVKLVVDGIEISPKDVTGKVVEPFIYEGTTYLPVRAVGEALGKTVEWDGNTKTVYVGNVPGEDIYLVDVCPPYEKTRYSAPDSFTMMGKSYSHGFELDTWSGTYALFNLNGEYETLEFDFGHVDDTDMWPNQYFIYLDGKLAQEINAQPDMLVQHVTVPLNHALQMKIVGKGVGFVTYYGFANAVLR